MSLTWWNNNYLFRRNLKISTFDLLPAGHPVTILIPNLNAAGKTREDFQDVTAVYFDGTNWIPLPTLAQLKNNQLQVQFDTYADIPAHQTLSNTYFIYYGNKQLLTAPILSVFVFNPFPITISHASSRITYTHPGEDWLDGTTKKVNARATFQFSGNQIRLNTQTGLNWGVVAVQLDNNSLTKVDLYRLNQTVQPVYTSDILEDTFHIFRVISTGQANAGSSDTQVNISNIQYMGYVKAIDLGEQIIDLSWSAHTGTVS